MNDISSQIPAGLDLRHFKGGALLHIKVRPNASRNIIDKGIAGALRLKLTAPPVNGAANSLCVKYLSSFFDVPKSRIKIVRGTRSKDKWLWFQETDPLTLMKAIESKQLHLKHLKQEC